MGVCDSVNKQNSKPKNILPENTHSHCKTITHEKISLYSTQGSLKQFHQPIHKKSYDEPTSSENNINSSESSNSNDSILNKISYLSLEASPYQQETLLYAKKGNVFFFPSIAGQWGFLAEQEVTSYKGYTDSKINDMNFCCLLFRILGGKTEQVEINKLYSADSTGPIQFFPNVDISNARSYSSKGCLNITMKGIEESSQVQIDKMMGWKNLHYSSADFLIDSERSMINYINKVRSLPQKFAELYLNNDNESCSSNDIYSLLTEYTSIPQLENDISLTKAAKAHAKDLGEHGLTGHQGTDHSTVKDRIKKSSNKKSLHVNYFGENCFYGINDPLSLIINMLMDDCSTDKNNRLNILNPSYTHIGISIRQHFSYNWCCVIVFGGNDQ